jgi:hypothetical protein
VGGRCGGRNDFFLSMGVARAELGDELGRVEGRVYGEGFRDDEEGGGECCYGQLFARNLSRLANSFRCVEDLQLYEQTLPRTRALRPQKHPRRAQPFLIPVFA